MANQLNIVFEETKRGNRGTFVDARGDKCSIQVSPADPNAILLGVDVTRVGTVLSARMQLTREQVKDLIPVLQRFVDSGVVWIKVDGAICDYCHKNMMEVNGCNYGFTLINDKNFRRIRFGSETDSHPIPFDERCHDCNCLAGNYHHPGCDVEQCPNCGGQRISCGCPNA